MGNRIGEKTTEELLKEICEKLEIDMNHSVEEVLGVTERFGDKRKVKCTGGEWYISSEGFVSKSISSPVWRRRGLEFETKEDAEKENRQLTELRIINNIIRKFNEMDAFVADWYDREQPKYFIKYSVHTRLWSSDYYFSTQYLGYEYCSEKSADEIVKLLNNKRIYGIER